MSVTNPGFTVNCRNEFINKGMKLIEGHELVTIFLEEVERFWRVLLSSLDQVIFIVFG
ncbi:hypothetical protein Hanom_Chr15g01352611 [Helianthus anomalus]